MNAVWNTEGMSHASEFGEYLECSIHTSSLCKNLRANFVADAGQSAPTVSPRCQHSLRLSAPRALTLDPQRGARTPIPVFPRLLVIQRNRTSHPLLPLSQRRPLTRASPCGFAWTTWQSAKTLLRCMVGKLGMFFSTSNPFIYFYFGS